MTVHNKPENGGVCGKLLFQANIHILGLQCSDGRMAYERLVPSRNAHLCARVSSMKHCNFQQRWKQCHVISGVPGECSHLLRKQLQRLFNVLRQLCKLDACSMKVLQGIFSSVSTVQWLVPQYICKTDVGPGPMNICTFLEQSCQESLGKHGVGENLECFHLIINSKDVFQRRRIVYAPVRAVNATMFGLRARVATRSKKYLAARCCFLPEPQQARMAEDMWYIWMLIP